MSFESFLGGGFPLFRRILETSYLLLQNFTLPFLVYNTANFTSDRNITDVGAMFRIVAPYPLLKLEGSEVAG